MKGTNLGEFQEIVMLAILLLDDNAYGVTVQEEVGSRTGRSISRGALHAALSRLEEKGLIRSEFGAPSAERGGRRKKLYQVTNTGIESLQEARRLREEMWQVIPQLNYGKS